MATPMFRGARGGAAPGHPNSGGEASGRLICSRARRAPAPPRLRPRRSIPATQGPHLSQDRPAAPPGSHPRQSIDVTLDLATAVDLADYFVARGKPASALKTLHAVAQLDPRDDALRAKYAALLFRCREREFPFGTVDRSRFLLHVIGFDCLSPDLEEAYFDNLEAVLGARPRSAAKGALVLGLGPGRCGSTALTVVAGRAAGCCATHENPPLVHWSPKPEQLAFHERRFALLLDYFPVVFDAAHWWLNAVEALLTPFPDLKLIALRRDPGACAESFLKVKGSGPGAINHWADHDGRYWKPALWDALYPSRRVAEFAATPPDFADPEAVRRLQFDMVRAYAADYNDAMSAWQETLADRVLAVPTESLSDSACQRRIYQFLGLEGRTGAADHNRGTTEDGTALALKF